MQKKRCVWISVAQIFASLAVVILHCNGVFWQFPSGRLWITSNFLECFFYWAVPVFFMISGANLLDYQEKYSTFIFFKKRLIRVVLPFVAWSFIGIIYRIIYDGWNIPGGWTIFDGIINTKYIGIYWYFIPLIAIYLCVPFIAAIDVNKKIKTYYYASIVGFIFVSIIPTFCKLFNVPFNSEIIPNVFNGYVLYVFMGYLIKNIELSSVRRKIIYIFGIFGMAVQFIGTDILSQQASSIDTTFKGYLNFPAVLQAVAVFVMFRYFPYDKLSAGSVRIIDEISKHTFGVYLMHIYFVWTLPEVFHFSSASIYFRTFGAVGIFCLCTLLCWLISKIPVLNKILGC